MKLTAENIEQVENDYVSLSNVLDIIKNRIGIIKWRKNAINDIESLVKKGEMSDAVFVGKIISNHKEEIELREKDLISLRSEFDEIVSRIQKQS